MYQFVAGLHPCLWTQIHPVAYVESDTNGIVLWLLQSVMVLLGNSLIKEDGEEVESWGWEVQRQQSWPEQFHNGGANDATLLKVDSVIFQDSLPAPTGSILDSEVQPPDLKQKHVIKIRSKYERADNK